MKITPVILSGGSGARLWPLSRKQHPKQYLSFVNEQTMLQATIQRLQGLGGVRCLSAKLSDFFITQPQAISALQPAPL